MLTKEKLYAMKYLKSEYNRLQNHEYIWELGCTFALINNDIFHWKFSLTSPRDTPYEGGMFVLTVDFPEDYPHRRPEVRFTNKIYHLNVSPSNGHVNIIILNNWKPKTTMIDIILDIYALFYNQNPFCPYSFQMAIEYQKNRKEFDRKAKEWTQKYASINV